MADPAYRDDPHAVDPEIGPAHDTLPPVTTGGWNPHKPAGGRLFVNLGPIALENGEVLPQSRIAYETWGHLNPQRSNAVLICHALTGDSHVAGEADAAHPTAGWWNDIVGPGKAIDTDTYFVVVPNVLGGCQGSTGPASLAPDGHAWGSRFPQICTRDMMRAEQRLADYLGIYRWDMIVGPSAGGHRALEWAVSAPERLGSLVLIATGAQTTADQVAWAHMQNMAIELDPDWSGGDYYDQPHGPDRGLGLAREIAHATYRSPGELNTRFGREPQSGEDPLHGGRLAVQSYLDHHAAKLARRFDAGSYVALNKALITHDVAAGRGDLRTVLRGIEARTLVVSVDTDRLFPAGACRAMAEMIPGAIYRQIHSDHGHDGFLIESARMDRVLRDFLYQPVKQVASMPVAR
ncbi:MAG: homoserine O-acetyltransferase [Varibaculum sp.]|nr:homoserine O-acetyltransferase [Varibaculum sp.]